jgi:hypothetical protein
MIRELPPGNYRLSAWYPGPQFAPLASDLHIDNEDVSRRLKIDVPASALLPVSP